MTFNIFNKEGYKDITSYEALTNVSREDKKVPFMPLVYVCSPYAGEVQKNVELARSYSRFAIEKKCIPITPHLLYPQFMDDNSFAMRRLAQHINYVLLGTCDELWVFGKNISSGMSFEIRAAEKRKMRIRYFDETLREVTE